VVQTARVSLILGFGRGESGRGVGGGRRVPG